MENKCEALADQLVVQSKNQLKKEARWQRKQQARLKYENVKPRKKKRSGRSTIKKDAAYNGTVVIDISYYNMMTKSECDSLAAQVARLYASNRRSEHGFKLCICDPQGLFRSNILARKYPDYGKWSLNWCEQLSFNTCDCIYLSADAEACLQTLEDDKVYIIGGLVDRNRHKKSSLDRAASLGIPSARLPIRESVDLKSSHILTVLHVYEILLKYREHGSWKSAITSCLPQRKMK